MSASLRSEVEGRVLRLTLNRPEKRNALSLALCREIVEACEGAERNSGIGALLLAAEGSAFCAGMDVDEAVAGSAEEHAEAHERIFTLGARLRVPLVAAVNGPALGGGLGLVANAHVAVAAQGSSFGLTEIRLGMWPFVVWRSVVLALGERRAVELALTGRLFGTQEALAWGLVQHVVPTFELEDRAWQIASGVAASSPDTVRHGLTFVHATRAAGWDEAGRIAAAARKEAFEGADFREGVAAFREKRPPNWPSLHRRDAEDSQR